MKAMHFGTAALALCLLSLPAAAQDNAAQDNDDTPKAESYDGGSFTIVPPPGWLLISGSLTEKELAKLPENIREHYSQRNTDVIFMNIASLDATDTKGFKDSLNIVSINERIVISDDLVKELTAVLEQQYASMFSQTFKITKTEIVSHGATSEKAFYLEGSYKILNYDVKMAQTLIPSKTESIVLTCTYADRAESQKTPELCATAVKSLSFK